MTASARTSDRIGGRARGGFRAFADLSLRIKLILVFLIVTLLSVGIIAFLNIRSTRAALTTEVGNGLETVAVSQAQNIGTILARRVSSMQALGQGWEIQAGITAQNDAYSGDMEAILSELARLDGQWVAAGDNDPLIRARLEGALARQLKSATSLVPDFAEAFVTDRYGGLVAASDRTSDYYQADEDWWQTAYNDGRGAVYIGSPEFDESTGVIGINMAVPAYAQNHEILGIVRTTLDVTALVDQMAEIKLGETGGTDLLIKGEIFNRRAGSGLEVLEPALLAQLETSPEGYGEAIYAGRDSLIGYATISSPTGEQFVSDLGWKVILHEAREEALSVVTAQTRNTGLLAVLVTVVAVGVAVALGQLLANPITYLTGVVTRFTQGDLDARIQVDSRDETGLLGASFNQMAEQISKLLAGLEARGRALETSAEVSRRLSTILDQKQLVAEVVERVQKAFGYYHAHIYLVDETSGDPSTGSGQALVMAGGTGEAGRAMLAAGHRIPQGKGLVGRAAGANTVVLVPDVSQEEGWLPNPLLPDTQSEIAVPIAVGGRVLGVLDVQHNVAGGLGQDDAELLESIAGQVAVALQNTRLFAEARQKAERETRANLIVQRIQSATTVESALQIAVRELGQALGAPETLVRLEAAAPPGNGRSERARGEHDQAEAGS
jgi:putative methionine-R-sulfoxide reductase with GAF domain